MSEVRDANPPDEEPYDRFAKYGRIYPPQSGKKMSWEEILTQMGDVAPEHEIEYSQAGDTHRLSFRSRAEVPSEADALSDVENAAIESPPDAASLQIETIQLDVVIMPTDPAAPETGSGSGWERKEDIPRIQYLTELLADLNIPFRNLQGKPPEGTVRKEPYVVFVLPLEDIVILVCNETDNATYIVYRPDQLGDQPAYTLRKKELESFMDRGNVRIVRYPGDKVEWQERIFEAIVSKPLITTHTIEHEILEGVTRKTRSEVLGIRSAEREQLRRDGWLNRIELFTAFQDLDDLTIFKQKAFLSIVDALAQAMKDGVRELSDARGRRFRLFSPAFFEALIAEARTQLMPPGWYTIEGLQQRLNSDFGTVKKYIDRIGPQTESMIRPCLHPVSKKRTFCYSPAYLQRIIDLIGHDPEGKEPPVGWKTLDAMKRMLSKQGTPVSSKAGLAELIAELLQQSPALEATETGAYEDHNKRLQAHYSPVIVALCRARLNELNTLHSGWLWAQQVAAMLGIRPTALGPHIDTLRSTHPELYSQGSVPNPDRRERFDPRILPLLAESIDRAQMGIQQEKVSPGNLVAPLERIAPRWEDDPATHELARFPILETPPPEHWQQVSQYLGSHGWTVRQSLPQFQTLRQSMPGEYARHKKPNTPDKTARWYGSPNGLTLLGEQVTLRMEVRPQAAVNDETRWLSIHAIKEHQSADRASIQKILAFFAKLLPQQQVLFKTIGRRTYYHRDFVRLLEPLFAQRFSIEEIQRFLEQHPLPESSAIDTVDDCVIFLGPLLEKLLRVSPWPTMTAAAAQLGIYVDDFRKATEQLRAQSPESFVFNRVDPQVIQQLKSQFQGKTVGLPSDVLFPREEGRNELLIKAPADWHPASWFWMQVGIDAHGLQRMITSDATLLRERDWVRWYRDKKGKPRVHFFKDYLSTIRSNTRHKL